MIEELQLLKKNIRDIIQNPKPTGFRVIYNSKYLYYLSPTIVTEQDISRIQCICDSAVKIGSSTI